MNIFVLDKDPEICAKYHCDKHVVNQITNITKLLCSTLYSMGSRDSVLYNTLLGGDDCNTRIINWTSQLHNFKWTLNLGIALLNEYTYRFNKEHTLKQTLEKCSTVYESIKDNFSGSLVSLYFYIKLDSVYMVIDSDTYDYDIINSYHNYYIMNKKNLSQYTKREKPEWLDNNITRSYMPVYGTSRLRDFLRIGERANRQNNIITLSRGEREATEIVNDNTVIVDDVFRIPEHTNYYFQIQPSTRSDTFIAFEELLSSYNSNERG